MDTEISLSTHENIGNLPISAHGIARTRILVAGFFTDDMIASNCSAPLYGLGRNHKVNNEEVVGSHLSTVCVANL